MNSLLLIIIEVIICNIGIIFLYKKYQTDGLYVYGIVATLASCIMSLKQIEIMGISVPVGFGVSVSLIIVGNLITQKKGFEEIKTYLSLILITTLLSCCFLNLTGLIKSSDYLLEANKSFDNIFKYNLRIYLAFLVSTLISIYLSSKLYYSLKKMENKIIISNTFSIIIVEFIDTTIFSLIAYLFTLDATNIIFGILFRYLIKLIIGLLGTITIYIGNKLNK